MHVRIEGTDLPGRGPAGGRHAGVHVGVQRRAEVVDLVAGDAASASWCFEVSVRQAADGTLDVGGPFVHGSPGGRFFYLSWGTVAGTGAFTMFRRAKLHLDDIAADTLATAATGAGVLVGRLGLTDDRGGPRCARVRPPDVTWHVAAGPR